MGKQSSESAVNFRTVQDLYQIAVDTDDPIIYIDESLRSAFAEHPCSLFIFLPKKLLQDAEGELVCYFQGKRVYIKPDNR